jgi:hypothetical protein
MAETNNNIDLKKGIVSFGHTYRRHRLTHQAIQTAGVASKTQTFHQIEVFVSLAS